MGSKGGKIIMEEKIEVEYTIPNEDYVEEYDEVVEDE